MKKLGQFLREDIEGSWIKKRLYVFYRYASTANFRPLIYLLPFGASLFYLGAGHDDAWIMLFAGETLGKGPWFLNHNGVPQEISTSVLGALLAGAASAIAPSGEEYAYWKITAWLPAMLASIGIFEIVRIACGQRLAAYCLLVLCCVPQWHYWAWGGVESGLFWLTIILFAYSLASFTVKPDWRASVTVALLAALLPLVRADALWAPLLLLYFVVFARNASLWAKWMPFLLASTLTAVFHLTRYAMTGAWLPNPAYAKTSFSIESVSQGISYLIGFHTNSPLHVALAFSIPLAIHGVYRLFRNDYETSTTGSRLYEWCGAMILIIDFTTVIVGGDWMGHHRFAIRSLPLKIIVIGLWAHKSLGHGALSSLSFNKKQLIFGIFLMVALSGLAASGIVELRGKHQGSQNLHAPLLPWKGLSNYFIKSNVPSLRDATAISPWIENSLPRYVAEARRERRLPLKIASYQAGYFPRELRRHYSSDEILFIDIAGLSDYRIGKLSGPRIPLGLQDGLYNWAEMLAYKQHGLGQFLANCPPDIVYVIASPKNAAELMDYAGYRLAYKVWVDIGDKIILGALVYENLKKDTGICASLK